MVTSNGSKKRRGRLFDNSRSPSIPKILGALRAFSSCMSQTWTWCQSLYFLLWDERVGIICLRLLWNKSKFSAFLYPLRLPLSGRLYLQGSWCTYLLPPGQWPTAFIGRPVLVIHMTHLSLSGKQVVIFLVKFQNLQFFQDNDSFFINYVSFYPYRKIYFSSTGTVTHIHENIVQWWFKSRSRLKSKF